MGRSLTNAKNELLHLIRDNKILCSEIELEEHQEMSIKLDYFKNPLVKLVESEYDRKIVIRLFPGYSESEYELFLRGLDIQYDSGYGGQRLFGIVWMQDGTWLSRGEYDGSEWWDWNKLPELPTDFKRALNIENILE
jgi:hypothetical protein